MKKENFYSQGTKKQHSRHNVNRPFLLFYYKYKLDYHPDNFRSNCIHFTDGKLTKVGLFRLIVQIIQIGLQSKIHQYEDVIKRAGVEF